MQHAADTVDLSLCDFVKKALERDVPLGETQINLREVSEFKFGVTKWFDLELKKHRYLKLE